jgi:signal transduction histidine kinase
MLTMYRRRHGSLTRADHFAGPLVTAVMVLGVNALTGGEFIAQPIYLACVAYAVFRGGAGSGLVSTALVVGDALMRAVAAPLGLDEPLRQVNIVALACLALVLVTSPLKRRADRAHELSRANAELTDQLMDHVRADHAATALAAMTRTLSDSVDVSSVHQRVVSTIVDVSAVRHALLYSVDTTSQELVCVAAAGDIDDTRWLGHRMPAGAGIAGRAVVEQRAVCAMEIESEPRANAFPDMATSTERVTALPLRTRGRVVGALELAVGEGQRMGKTELDLLSIVAGHAALALDNSRLSTELRTTLDKLNESRRHIVDGARLQATEEMAAGVAHYVNNRLTVILAGIQILLPKLSHNHHWREALEIVERTALDTARLIDRLRQFTMKHPREAGQSGDINLAAQRAVELCRPEHAEAAGRGAHAEIVLKLGTVPRVAADESLLEEAVAHVVRNAIEALTGPGTVVVTTCAAGGKVVCAISDTGPGMPEDVVQRAAEPFFTTKGPQRPGLGLSCALGLVRQLGGQFEINSRPGAGTRVTIGLSAYVP